MICQQTNVAVITRTVYNTSEMQSNVHKIMGFGTEGRESVVKRKPMENVLEQKPSVKLHAFRHTFLLLTTQHDLATNYRSPHFPAIIPNGYPVGCRPLNPIPVPTCVPIIARRSTLNI